MMPTWAERSSILRASAFIAAEFRRETRAGQSRARPITPTNPARGRASERRLVRAVRCAATSPCLAQGCTFFVDLPQSELRGAAALAFHRVEAAGAGRPRGLPVGLRESPRGGRGDPPRVRRERAARSVVLVQPGGTVRWRDVSGLHADRDGDAPP